MQKEKEKAKKSRWKKQKCATFSRTIELSYPNNNLDNRSMAAVPVSQSVSRSHALLRYVFKFALTESSEPNQQPMRSMSKLSNTSTSRFISFSTSTLNCSDLDLGITRIIWLSRDSEREREREKHWMMDIQFHSILVQAHPSADGCMMDYSAAQSRADRGMNDDDDGIRGRSTLIIGESSFI